MCGGTANGWVRLPITGRIGLRVSVRERFRGGLVSGAWTKRNNPLVGDSGISRAVACVGEKEALVGRAQKRRVACRGRTRESQRNKKRKTPQGFFPPTVTFCPLLLPCSSHTHRQNKATASCLPVVVTNTDRLDPSAVSRPFHASDIGASPLSEGIRRVGTGGAQHSGTDQCKFAQNNVVIRARRPT